MALKEALVKGAKENHEFSQKQTQLKEKYHVKDENVVVVEKSNMLKFVIQHSIGLFHLLFQIALVILALIGLVSIVYPETRTALWLTALDIKNQLFVLF